MGKRRIRVIHIELTVLFQAHDGVQRVKHAWFQVEVLFINFQVRSLNIHSIFQE